MVEYEVVPPPKLKRDYRGRTVRTVRELRNGYVVIPKGAIGAVSHNTPRGAELRFSPCGCCGMSAIITRLAAGPDFEFVEAAK